MFNLSLRFLGSERRMTFFMKCRYKEEKGHIQNFYSKHILKPIHLRVIYDHSGCRQMLIPLEALILKLLGNVEVPEVSQFSLKNTVTIRQDPLQKSPISTACPLVCPLSQTLATMAVN